MAGVARQLGLEGLNSELLLEATARWPGWATGDERLRAVDGLEGLRPWLRVAEPGPADRVLQALARLASPSGGDSVPAAGALAWVLLPGACSVARRLQSLSPRIDELVAAQLWLEVRTFPWQRLGKVAANVLANVRAAVMLDCGVSSQMQRSDRTWSRTQSLDPRGFAWTAVPAPPTVASAEEELASLLVWACESKVISEEDRSLLLCLAATADGTSPATRRRRSGLMGDRVSAVVGEAFGVSSVTVRRRARRTMAALNEACIATEWFAA